MPEADHGKDAREFHLDVPARNRPFHLKGAGALDWGMQNRLARIFDAASGRTVMLAIDHGYFQGPTTGLERIDVSIVPLLPWCDALMVTRGALRTMIPSTFTKGIVLRASGGPSILRELSNETIALDADEACRLDVAALAVQVFVGGEHETRSVRNLTRLVDLGNRLGIPIFAVTAVGKDMTRDARYFRLACRICAELGAHFVKTYYVPDGFETVRDDGAAGAPAPAEGLIAIVFARQASATLRVNGPASSLAAFSSRRALAIWILVALEAAPFV